MITDINSEDRLVQKTFTEHLERVLGWESIYAFYSETFGPASALVLLRHKFLRGAVFAIGAAQHGQRDKERTSATIKRRRMVATEFGI